MHGFPSFFDIKFLDTIRQIISQKNKLTTPWGRGGGELVSVLTFYSDNPSLNPTEAYSFSVKFVFEKNENEQKEAGVGPFLPLPLQVGTTAKHHKFFLNVLFLFIFVLFTQQIQHKRDYTYDYDESKDGVLGARSLILILSSS